MASLTPNPADDPKSFRTLYAQTIIQQYHESKGISQDTPLPTPTLPVQPSRPICIIGAGVAGLYAAIMLDFLRIDYEIIEASDRVGGRLFSKKLGEGRYEYFDVGAMRFPKTPFMKRTFELFKSLNIPTMPYHFSSGHTFLYYNTIRYQRDANGNGPPAGTDPFKVQGSVGARAIKEGSAEIVASAIKPFRDALMKDWKTGMKTLMEADDYSVRSFLRFKGWNQEVINWVETMEDSTGSFDRALSEEVLDSMAFDYPVGPAQTVSWFCVDGGSNEIAQKMYDSIRTRAKVRFEKRVTKIEKGLNSSMAVTTSDRTTRTYSQVISSIPLPCLNMVDLDGLSLNWDIKSALRALAYGPATKIGIMFTQNWWEPLGIVGGQSYTDSLLRTVVYPSYPESGPKSRVLIVSYCWTQDALRMGSLFATDPASEKILLNLVLDELQKVHGFSVRQYYDEKTCRIFPWNWYSDNLTLGAYAAFGPGQFKNLYPRVTQPACEGTLHFIGEATSAEHAWVVGALNSAWRGVYEALVWQYGVDSPEMKKFKQEFGPNSEWNEDVLLRHIYLATHPHDEKV